MELDKEKYIKKNSYLSRVLREGKNHLLLNSHIPYPFLRLGQDDLNKFNKKDFKSFDFIKETWDFEESDERIFNLLKLKGHLKLFMMEIHSIKEEFIFFKDHSVAKIEKIRKDFKKYYKDDLVKRDKDLEVSRIEDISTGIFDVHEASSRKVFNSIKWNNWSKNTIEEDRKLKYFLKIYLSFMYLKFEEVTRLIYDIFYESEKYIFLKDKIIAVKEILEIPDYIKNNIDDVYTLVNKHANHYKHQAPLPIDNDSLKDFYIINNYLEVLINEISSLFNYSNIINKIDQIHYEHEGIVNPLGLTGFE